MKRLLNILLVLIVLTGTATARNHKSLVILHLNDTHSHLDPLHDGTAGVLERSVFIDSVRRSEGKNNVLLLHAGDFSQGTSYFTYLHGDLEIDLINAIGYDCVCLGNHEFDNGLEELARRLSSIKCPVVCANYDFSPFEAGKYIKPYAILKKAGMKIGVIGLLTDISSVVPRDIADRIPQLNTIEEANKWADYLKNEENCDLVIALTHIGFAGEKGVNDTDLIPQSRNIDIVVGGHSHTKLDDLYYSTDRDGRKVPIIQDWCWGQQVGLLRVSR